MEKTSSQLIRVAVVDDHQIVIDGIEKYLNESGIACLAGYAHTISSCWGMLKASLPDVLMLDINLPDGNGIDLCPQIKKRYPSVKILMLTNYDEYSAISHVMNNGASGYILKNSMPEEIIEGIRVVFSGKQFLSEDADIRLKKGVDTNITLTRRERELLKMIIEGKSSVEIADKMILGYETIRSYRKNLHQKLGAHNTAELTKKALNMKLI